MVSDANPELKRERGLDLEATRILDRFDGTDIQDVDIFIDGGHTTMRIDLLAQAHRQDTEESPNSGRYYMTYRVAV